MKALRIALSMTFGLAATTTAAAPPTPSVNIANTPLPVTVQNPQTSVTVDNTSANPLPVTVQGGITVQAEPQFVGFSDDTVQGNVGLAGMHAACRDTFGAGARMCLDIEVFKTRNLQPTSVSNGWIQPTPAGVSPSYGDPSYNCSWWTDVSVNATGAVLSGERMQFFGFQYVTYLGGTPTVETAYCADARPVACCQ